MRSSDLEAGLPAAVRETSDGDRSRAVGVAREAVVAGIVGAVLGLVGSWRPSLWTDEVATLSAAGRSWSQLWELLGDVDAVHGFYYLVMHVWIELFGTSPFALRLPSALAVGVAAAGLYVLADRLAGRGTARAAAIVFVVMPGVTWMAVEARSFAMVSAVTVWAAVLLVRALERGGRWWIAYSLLLVLSIVFFVQSVLVVVAHAVTVAWVRPARRAVVGWMMSAAVAVCVTVPFVLVTFGQRDQVDWIGDVDGATLRSVLSYQWFQGAEVFGAVVLLLAAAVVLLPRQVGAAWSGRPVSLGALALPWAILPTAAVLGFSLVLDPMYVPRYLTYTAPAVALLAGAALAAVRQTWIRAVLVAVLVVAAAGTYVDQRGAVAKDFTDWQSAAGVLADQARPGDVVVFAPDDGQSRSPRRLLDAYADRFPALVDVGLTRDSRDTGEMWDRGGEVADLADGLVDVLGDEGQAWLIVAPSELDPDVGTPETVLGERGLEVEATWSGPSTTIYRVTHS